MNKMLIQYVRRPFTTAFVNSLRENVLHAVMKSTEFGSDAVYDVDKVFDNYVTNQKVGVMLAFKDADGKVAVGFAAWNEYADEYDKDFMFEVAHDRAVTYLATGRVPKHIPAKIQKALHGFLNRARKYFKDGTMPEWTEVYK